MGLRFRARDFRTWSRRQFMLRAVRAMRRGGPLPAAWIPSLRESFRRLRREDDCLRRLFR